MTPLEKKLSSFLPSLQNLDILMLIFEKLKEARYTDEKATGGTALSKLQYFKSNVFVNQYSCALRCYRTLKITCLAFDTDT